MNRQYSKMAIVMAGLWLASLACGVPEAIQNAEIPEDPNQIDMTPVVARSRGDPFFVVRPEEYCPGEMLTLEWSAGRPPETCGPRDPTCPQYAALLGDSGLNVYGLSIVSPDALALEGSTKVPTVTAFRGSGPVGEYWFRYEASLESDFTDPYFHATRLARPVTEGSPAGTVTITYFLVCDPDEHVWTWDVWNRPHPEDQPSSSCVGISQVCGGNGFPGLSLHAEGSSLSQVFDPTTNWCLDARAGVYGFHPQDMALDPGGPYEGITGQPCSPGDPLPVDTNPDSNLQMESIQLEYVMSCMPLDTLNGSASEFCDDDYFDAASGGTATLPPSAGGAPSEPIFTPAPGSASCGSPCTSDAQCAGLGPNPACAGGACYDAQTCGGGTSGGDTSGGSVDCSAVGQRCNLDPSFGACPAGYTCGGPYDEFNYGTCQKAGCP